MIIKVDSNDLSNIIRKGIPEHLREEDIRKRISQPIIDAWEKGLKHMTKSVFPTPTEGCNIPLTE